MSIGSSIQAMIPAFLGTMTSGSPMAAQPMMFFPATFGATPAAPSLGTIPTDSGIGDMLKTLVMVTLLDKLSGEDDAKTKTSGKDKTDATGNQLKSLFQQLETLDPESPSAIRIQNQIAQIVDNGSPEDKLDSLFLQLKNLDPESPQAMQIKARIDQFVTDNPQFKGEARDRNHENDVDTSKNVVASLNQIKANLDPNSAQAKSIESRIAALEAHIDVLDLQDKDAKLSDKIAAKDPDVADQLDSLFAQREVLDPESPDAVRIMAQVAQIGDENPAIRDDVAGRVKIHNLMDLKEVVANLNQLKANLEPESNAYHALTSRISAVEAEAGTIHV